MQNVLPSIHEAPFNHHHHVGTPLGNSVPGEGGEEEEAQLV